MKIGTIPSLVATAVLVAAPAQAAAQDNARHFKPTGKWSLDYGDDYCRLARTFSDGKDDLALAIERIEPGQLMRMILISNGIKMYRSADEIGWHFTPTDAERKARYTKSETADGKQYFNLGLFSLTPFVPPAPGTPPAPPAPYSREKEQEAAKGMNGFVLDEGLTNPVQVDADRLDAPIAALQACADDLAKTWGLDAAKLKTQTSAAIPEGGGVGLLPQGIVAFADFPKLSGGSNQVRLMIDASGKPTSCTIHWATLEQATNDRICKTLMADTKFTPAKDAGGQPMAGYYIASPTSLLPPFGGRRR